MTDSMATYDVVVVGSVNADLVVRVERRPAAQRSFPALADL
jgi:hypothetical protein